ncbi:von Willebrand factor type A domain protein [Ancylostoma ceylanicum]|uniref:von Willebrand factor type A domain protein n=1 Tax=Ancylostoma ceylanicum TaxID=53326 RepID=A0A0D6MAY0_9BILA|nr:von Willebrand factor type A domain protein [Ancylostoma ceylanicum]
MIATTFIVLQQSSGSHWLDGYPAEMCADLPPTTGALLDGMVDVPAIARRPIICTYGNPPNLPALHPSDQCNKAAHYDEETKRCLCNNPEKDGRIYDPEKYGHYPEGIVCIDCANTTRTRSIVFILDNTGTVGESGWKAQKEFMMKVMKAMKNIRVGLVILSGDPHVEIPMDYFENNRKKFEDFLENQKWGNKWTAVGVALFRARELLQAETTREKIIIIISDGDQDICGYNDDGEDCPSWKVENIEKHPQEKEAEKNHAIGIRHIYVSVENSISSSPESKERNHAIGIRHIYVSVENSISSSPESKERSFDTTTLENLMETICNAEI